MTRYKRCQGVCKGQGKEYNAGWLQWEEWNPSVHTCKSVQRRSINFVSLILQDVGSFVQISTWCPHEQMPFSAVLLCGRHCFSPHKIAEKNHRFSFSHTFVSFSPGFLLCMCSHLQCNKYWGWPVGGISMLSGSPYPRNTTVCPYHSELLAEADLPTLQGLSHGENVHLQYWDTICFQEKSQATWKKSTCQKKYTIKMNCADIKPHLSPLLTPPLIVSLLFLSPCTHFIAYPSPFKAAVSR